MNSEENKPTLNQFQNDILKATARIATGTTITTADGKAAGMIQKRVPEALIWMEFWVPLTEESLGFDEYYRRSIAGLKRADLLVDKESVFFLSQSKYVYRTIKGIVWDLLVRRADEIFPGIELEEYSSGIRYYHHFIFASPTNSTMRFEADCKKGFAPNISRTYRSTNGFCINAMEHNHLELTDSGWDLVDLTPDDFQPSQFRIEVEKPSTPVRLPLTEGQKKLWDALKHRALTGKQLAKELETSEEVVRQWVLEIKKSGYPIDNKSGRGYFRPDAMPDDFHLQ